MSDVVVKVEGLAKTYRKPFTGTKVEAVRGKDKDEPEEG